MSIYELVVAAPTEQEAVDFVDELLEEEIVAITPASAPGAFHVVVDLDVGLYMQAVMEGVLNTAQGWPDSKLVTWTARRYE
jgi:hypothetical protein